MAIYTEVKKNAYFDSVTLMLMSAQLKKSPGILEGAVMMGTDHNKRLMLDSGILDPATAESCGPNDLVIGFSSRGPEAEERGKALCKTLFEQKKQSGASGEKKQPRSLEEAVEDMEQANVAVISLPGRFAKHEAMKALKRGLHVLLFSDNVSIEEELELKEYAAGHGLLLMGPDCGTAIISGTALGFANVVRRGSVGVVAAAGTGLQEVTVLLDRLGSGISQAIGTGGRDVKDIIGGKTMLLALDALIADENTRVIGIVAKPPERGVLEAIRAKAAGVQKPVVACLMGTDPAWAQGSNIRAAATLEETAALLAALDQGRAAPALCQEKAPALPETRAGQKYVRGLYSGGTLCYESLLILKKELGTVFSNIGGEPGERLEDEELSRENTLVDMGDDHFTDGMPHPMIDVRLRLERLAREADDPEVAVILLDCVLGYGCHQDPAGALAEAITGLRQKLGDRMPAIVASVCGTEEDFQGRTAQEEKLRQAGVLVESCNARAARLAAGIVKNARG